MVALFDVLLCCCIDLGELVAEIYSCPDRLCHSYRPSLSTYLNQHVFYTSFSMLTMVDSRWLVCGLCPTSNSSCHKFFSSNAN